MSQFDDMFNAWQAANQDIQSTFKKQQVEDAAIEKAAYQRASTGLRFNEETMVAIDGDTFLNTKTGESFRLAGSQEGIAIDTFETMKQDPDDGTWYNPYERDRIGFKQDAKAYARLFNYDEKDVTPQLLVEQGEAQKIRLQNRLKELHGKRFDLGERDIYNRSTIHFRGGELDDLASADEGNAAYGTRYNRLGREADRERGIYDSTIRGERTLQRWAGDKVVTNTEMVLRGAIGLSQLADIAIGTGWDSLRLLDLEGWAAGENPVEGVSFTTGPFARALQALDRGVDTAADFLKSSTQLSDEARRAAFINVMQHRYQKIHDTMLEAGFTKYEALMGRWMAEGGDVVLRMADNPGQAVDAIFDSAIYTLGIGAGSRMIAKRLSKKGTKKIDDRLDKLKADAAAGKVTKEAELDLKKDLQQRKDDIFFGKDKATNRRITANTGMLVGITEGLTNANSVAKSFSDMSPEDWEQIPQYQQLVESGVSPEDAKTQLAGAAIVLAFSYSAVVGTLASIGTGAAGFEASIFRPRGGLSTLSRALKESAWGKAGKKVAKGTGRALAAGVKEAGEESIQSGGGEFFNQLAEFQAIGTDFKKDFTGAGVGTAFAEGAIVGFGSGAAISSAGSSLRLAAKGLVKGAEFIRGGSEIGQVTTENTTAAPTGNPSQVTEAVAEINDTETNPLERLSTFVQDVLIPLATAARETDQVHIETVGTALIEAQKLYIAASEAGVLTPELTQSLGGENGLMPELFSRIEAAVTNSSKRVKELVAKEVDKSITPEEQRELDYIIKENEELRAVPGMQNFPDLAQIRDNEAIKLAEELKKTDSESGSRILNSTNLRRTERALKKAKTLSEVASDILGKGSDGVKLGVESFRTLLQDRIDARNENRQPNNKTNLSKKYSQLLDKQTNKINALRELIRLRIQKGHQNERINLKEGADNRNTDYRAILKKYNVDGSFQFVDENSFTLLEQIESELELLKKYGGELNLMAIFAGVNDFEVDTAAFKPTVAPVVGTEGIGLNVEEDKQTEEEANAQPENETSSAKDQQDEVKQTGQDGGDSQTTPKSNQAADDQTSGEREAETGDQTLEENKPEIITVYTVDNKPVQAEVIARSKLGTVRVRIDGKEYMLGAEYVAEPLDQDRKLESIGSQDDVRELDDESLARFVVKLRAKLENLKAGNQANIALIAFAGTVRDLNRVLLEQRRRRDSKPTGQTQQTNQEDTGRTAAHAIEQAVKAALEAAGFSFTRAEDAPAWDLLRAVASKTLRENNPREAAAALSFVVHFELGLPNSDHTTRKRIEQALYEWITTGQIPTNIEAGLWASIIEIVDRLIAFFTGQEYSNIEGRFAKTLERIQKDPNSFTFEPIPGRSAISFQQVMDRNPEVAHILQILQDAGIPFEVTGSFAYADQTTIYRDASKPVHDVDIVFDSAADRDRALELVGSLYPNGQRMYVFGNGNPSGAKEVIGIVYPTKPGQRILDYKNRFTKKRNALRSWKVVDENGKVVGSNNMKEVNGQAVDNTKGDPGIAIDFMFKENSTRISGVAQTYVNPVTGDTVTITVTSFIEGFIHKLQFLRLKDIKDLIALAPKANLTTEELRAEQEAAKEEENKPATTFLEEMLIHEQEAEAAVRRKIPASDRSGIPLPAYEINPDLKNLAQSNSKTGVIQIRIPTIKEFFDYIEGKAGGASAQKKVVLEKLAEMGWTQERLRKVFNSRKKIAQFLVLHEQDHLDNDDQDVYWKEGKDLLTPDKIEIEVRATLAALNKLFPASAEARPKPDERAQASEEGREAEAEDETPAANDVDSLPKEEQEKVLEVSKLVPTQLPLFPEDAFPLDNDQESNQGPAASTEAEPVTAEKSEVSEEAAQQVQLDFETVTDETLIDDALKQGEVADQVTDQVEEDQQALQKHLDAILPRRPKGISKATTKIKDSATYKFLQEKWSFLHTEATPDGARPGYKIVGEILKRNKTVTSMLTGVESLKERLFIANRLPMHLLSFVRPAAKKTTSILQQGWDNALTLLDKYKDTLYASVRRHSQYTAKETQDKEINGVKTAIATLFALNESLRTLVATPEEVFGARFDRVIKGKDGKDKNIKKGFWGLDITTDDMNLSVADKIAIFMHMYLADQNKDGDTVREIPENALTAISAAALSWFVNNGKTTLGNDADAKRKILGLSSTETVRDPYKLLTDGTKFDGVVRMIGLEAVKALNLTDAQRADLNGHSFNKLVMSLGVMGVLALKDQQLIRVKQVNPSSLPSHSLPGPIRLIEIQTNVETKISERGNRYQTRSITEKAQSLIEDVQVARRALNRMFGAFKREREPVFKEPTMDDIPTHMANTNVKIPEEQRRNMLVSAQMRYVASTTGTSELDNFSDEELLLFVYGVSSEEDIDQNTIKGDIPAERSKRDRAVRSLEYAKEMLNELQLRRGSLSLKGEQEPAFFFANRMISSGRIYLNSSTVNPQQDKMHRFLFISEQYRRLVKFNNQESFRGMKMAIMLGLNLKLDGRAMDAVNEEEIEQMWNTLVMGNKDLMAVVNAMNSLEGRKYSEVAFEGGNLLEAMKKYLPENFHSLMALRTLANYINARQNGRGEIEVDLPMEIDGKTNGFIQNLLQMPGALDANGNLNPKILEQLKAGGIYLADDNIQGLRDYLAAGNKDNYNQLVDVVKSYVQEMLQWQNGIKDVYGEIRESFSGRFFTETGSGSMDREVLNRYELLHEGGSPIISPALPSRDVAAWATARHMRYAGHVINVTNQDGKPAINVFLALDREFGKGALMPTAYSAGARATRQAMEDKAIENYNKLRTDILRTPAPQRTEDMSDEVYEELLEEYTQLLRDKTVELSVNFLMIQFIASPSFMEYWLEQIGRDKNWRPSSQVEVLTLKDDLLEYFRYSLDNKNLKDLKTFIRDKTIGEHEKTSDRNLKPGERRNKLERLRFTTAYQMTLGYALERALNTQVGSRDLKAGLNNVLGLYNSIFVRNYQRRVRIIEEGQKGPITKAQQFKLFEDMIKRGELPQVRMPFSANLADYADHMEIIKYTSMLIGEDTKRKIRPQEGGVWIKNEEGYNLLDEEDGQATDVKYRTIRERLRGLTPIEDVGVKGLVNLIHSADASINGALMGNNLGIQMLNVHDAQISSVDHFWLLTPLANEEFYEKMRDWNMPLEVFRPMQRFLPWLHTEDSRLSTTEKEDIMRAFISKFMSRKELAEIRTSKELRREFALKLTEVQNLVNENTKARQKLFGREGISSVEQFALINHGHQPQEVAESNAEVARILADKNTTSSELVEFLKGNLKNIETYQGAIDNITLAITTQGFDPEATLAHFLLEMAKNNEDQGVSGTDVVNVLWRSFGATGSFGTNRSTDESDNRGYEQMRMLTNLLRGAFEDQAREPKVIAVNPEKYADMRAAAGFPFTTVEELIESNAFYDVHLNTVVVKADFNDSGELTNSGRIVGAIYHELIHAATYHNLLKAFNNKELNREFVRQFNEIAKWVWTAVSSPAYIDIKRELKKKFNPDLKAAPRLSLKSERKDVVAAANMMAEFMAYTMTTLNEPQRNEIENKLNIFNYVRGQKNDVLTFINTVASKDNLPWTNLLFGLNYAGEGVSLYAQENRFNARLFEEDIGKEVVPKADILQSLDHIRQAEIRRRLQPNPDQAFFNSIIDSPNFLSALDSINDLVIHIAEDHEGAINSGRTKNWHDPSRVTEIQLIMAGAVSTSDVDMSQQELYLHEIYHAITGWALGSRRIKDASGNPLPGKSGVINKRVRQIHAYVAANTDHTIFLEGIQTPTRIDVIRAKNRWNFLFGDVSGVAAVEQQFHEFFVMALTNPSLNRALTRLSTRMDRKDLKALRASKGFVETFTEWFGQLLRELRNLFRSTEPTIKEEMEHMLHQIVALNAHHNKQIYAERNKGNVMKFLDFLDGVSLMALARQNVAGFEQWLEDHRWMNQEEFEQGNNLKKIYLTVAQAVAVNADPNLTFEVLRREIEAANIAWERDEPALNPQGPGARGYHGRKANRAIQDLYEMITEILPERKDHRKFINAKLQSDMFVDVVRQQAITGTYNHLQHIWDPKKTAWTSLERTSVTSTWMRTDISSLQTGTLSYSISEIMNMVMDFRLVDQEITHILGLINQLAAQNAEAKAKFDYVKYIELQAKGLANMMINGETEVPMQMMNAFNIVHMRFNSRGVNTGSKWNDLVQATNKLTSLYALKLVPEEHLNAQRDLIIKERARGIHDDDTGFGQLLGMHLAYVELSQEELFEGDPTNMMKGYIYEVYDETRDVKTVPYLGSQTDKEMAAEGYKKVQQLVPNSTLVSVLNAKDVPIHSRYAMYVATKGMATYMKGILSFTSEQKSGTGLFDVAFKSQPGTPGHPVHRDMLKDTAKQVHRARNILIQKERNALANYIKTGRAPKIAPAVPSFNADGGIHDFRYMMSSDQKDEILGRRDYFDEVLPKMYGNLRDKLGTAAINTEAVQLIVNEWNSSPAENENEFIRIGAEAPTEHGRDMWALLPEKTKIAFREEFGGDYAMIRRDLQSLILGYRKLLFANNKFLGPTAPAVRIAEKVWGQLMKYRRFQIAILTPKVVIGNLISNIALLLSDGINPIYFYREAKNAVASIDSFRNDLREAAILDSKILAGKTLNQNVSALIAQRDRLAHTIAINPARPLVESGLFTSIIEDFSANEDSFGRKQMNKIVDVMGGNVRGGAVLGVLQNIYMLPGSEAGKAAMLATQYGDFIGRFVKYKYDTEIRKRDPEDAKHDALRMFIYYNTPQNRYLQYLNDNGFFMFTKFFFRIQPVLAKLFIQHPARSLIIYGLQQSLVSGEMGENIYKYTAMPGLLNKFNVTPWDHVFGGDIWDPNLLKWLPGVFWDE